MNRGGGPEGVIDAVEQRAPDGFTNIGRSAVHEERKAIVRGYASTRLRQQQVTKPQSRLER